MKHLEKDNVTNNGLSGAQNNIITQRLVLNLSKTWQSMCLGKVKVKQFLYRPGVAQTVPGS
jgi:hypothetical protein